MLHTNTIAEMKETF